MSRKRSVRLTSDKARVLSEFLQRQPEQTRRFFHPFEFDLQSVQAAFSDADMRIYAFRDGGEMVAMWLLQCIEGQMPQFGIAVDAAVHRQGYGDTVMRLAKVTCKVLGHDGMWLCVYPDNVPARGLYKKVGFRETGMMPDGQVRMEWMA